MRRIALALLATAGIVAPALAHADYLSGMQHYDRGEYEEAQKAWSASATDGDPRVRYWLGVLSESGRGTEQNATIAAEHFRAAADAGFPQAQSALGYMYSRGIGVDRDVQAGCGWWLLAAVQGLAPAQYGVAMCYELGYGFEKNSDEALFWYKQAAARGSQEAQTKVNQLEVAGASSSPNLQLGALGDEAGDAYAGSTTVAVTDAPAAPAYAGDAYSDTAYSDEAGASTGDAVRELAQQVAAVPLPPQQPAPVMEQPVAMIATQIEPDAPTAAEPATAAPAAILADAAPRPAARASIAAPSAAPAAPQPELRATPVAHRMDAGAGTVQVWLASVFSESDVRSEWRRLKAHYRPYLDEVAEPIVTQADTAKGHVYRIHAGPMDPTGANQLCDFVKGSFPKATCISQKPGR